MKPAQLLHVGQLKFILNYAYIFYLKRFAYECI